MTFIKLVLLCAALTLCSVKAKAADLLFTWPSADLREDGQSITGAKSYNIYVSIDNVAQPVISIPGDQTSYTLPNVNSGNYVAQISTVEDGLESDLSDPVSIILGEIAPAKPEKMTITIDLINAGILEVK